MAQDHVTVPVTTGDKPVADNVTNEPTVAPIENRMAKKQQQMISKAVDTTGARKVQQ